MTAPDKDDAQAQAEPGGTLAASDFEALLKALARRHELDLADAARVATAAVCAEAGKPFDPAHLDPIRTVPGQIPSPGLTSLREAAAVAMKSANAEQEKDHPSGIHLPCQTGPSAEADRDDTSVDFGDLNGNRPDTPGIISSHSFHLASEMFHNSEKAMSEGRVTSKEVREATGFKKFVVSPTFDSLSAALLTLNAIFIGIQVEFEFDGSTPGYIYAIDYMFCVLFVVELVMRFVGFGCRRFWCGQDRYWNWFDFFIVTLSTIDAFISIIVQGQATPLGNISILRIIRIVRITRVLRIIRVMKVFKDLRVLLAAIGSTIKTAVYAFVLIFCAMWMFGVALTQLAAEYTVDKRRIGIVIRHDDDLMFYFGSLGGSLMTLFMTISGGIDWKDAAMPLFEVNPLGIVIYLVYTLLMVLCVMNVLTGIFCQAAIETAQLDRDNVIQFQLMEKQRYIETLKSLFYSLDESGDGKCSLEEFQTHLSEVKMEALLRSLDIEVRDALTLFELFDTDGTGYIDLEEFVTGCITLRGGAKAVHMEKISSSNRNLHAKLAHVDEKVDKVMGQLKSKA